MRGIPKVKIRRKDTGKKGGGALGAFTWLLPPTRRYGARSPTTELSVIFVNFSIMILEPAISRAQSSMDACDQKVSLSVCLEVGKKIFVALKNKKKTRI